MNKIDLHIHSTCSDGACSPKEIIDIAKSNNIEMISITDHDTIEAYTNELFSYAKNNNISLIPGVEMSTKSHGIGIHILGYNFDLNNENLLKCLSMLKNARVDYLINVSNKLNKLGYKVNVDQLIKLPTVTKAHIATDIVTNQENFLLLEKTFNHIPSKGEFIETIMNENCPAYVEKFSISPYQASKIIKEANGKAILAHPTCYTHEDNLTTSQIDEIVKEMNADGIEANYLFIDRNNNSYDDSPFWNEFAKQNNLISTIGSDFHSFDNVRYHIGFSNVPFTLSNEENNSIIQSLTKKL